MLLATLQMATLARAAGSPLSLWRALLIEVTRWYGWALLMRPVARLSERYPLDWPPRSTSLAVHVTAALTANGVIALADAFVATRLLPSPRDAVATFRVYLLVGLPVTVIAYVAIVGGSALLRARSRLHARELEAAELSAQLRASQLAALRMQLQPHFLFNSLNAITALVRDADTARATRALALLGSVLRTAIRATDGHDITLGEELEFVRRYLELERLRFGERLRIVLDVPEPLLAARVPSFVLQPFVENALKHGVLRERAANEIAIRAHSVRGSLQLVVRDDGRGLGRADGADVARHGVGIANVRSRLERMYGRRANLSVADAGDGPGVQVEITVPLTLTADADATGRPAR